MGSDDGRFLTAKLQKKRRGARRKNCNNRKIFALLTLHRQQIGGWRSVLLHLKVFVVTAAALSAKVKIQVASLFL